MHDPQQELFSKIKTSLETLGYSVYDGVLPPENTPYPFVYLGDCRQLDDENKTQIFGTVYQTIHVWSNTPQNRGTVSTMLLNIKTTCRNIGHTDNFAWMVRNVTQRIIPDATTKTPLLHGVLEIEFRFS